MRKSITEHKKQELVRKTAVALNNQAYAMQRFLSDCGTYPADIKDSTTRAIINLANELAKRAERHLKALRTPSHQDGRLASVKRPWFNLEELEAISDILGLVGVHKTRLELSLYSYRQIKQMENWAAKSYLRASDNNVRVPKRPGFI